MRHPYRTARVWAIRLGLALVSLPRIALGSTRSGSQPWRCPRLVWSKRQVTIRVFCLRWPSLELWNPCRVFLVFCRNWCLWLSREDFLDGSVEPKCGSWYMAPCGIFDSRSPQFWFLYNIKLKIRKKFILHRSHSLRIEGCNLPISLAFSTWNL